MDISALLQYKSWDHKILLMSKILSKIGLIYLLFYTQLKILKDYLNKNLKKDFIQKTKIISKISYSIYSKEKWIIKILCKLLNAQYNYN